MRRFLPALLLTIITIGVTLGVVSEQPTEVSAQGERIPLPKDAAQQYSQLVQGQWVPVEMEPVGELPPEDANPADPHCDTATELFIPPSSSVAGQTTVNDAVTDSDDPVLSCAWGNPGGSRGKQGYRTVWYRFVAPVTGRLQISAQPNADYTNNYDTVIGLLSGTCDNLSLLSCNDDNNGFLSQVSPYVVSGQEYYIEIADWQLGVSGDAIANILVSINPNDTGSSWRRVDNMDAPRSRHAVAVLGDDLYVIGGQSVVSGNPVRSPRVDRYNTVTGTWTQLANLPGPDGFGYSNTTAALKAGRIYLPFGFVGDNQTYDNTHWVYDIAANAWITNAVVNRGGDPITPLGYTAAAAPDNISGYYVTGGINGPIFVTTTSVVTNTLWFFAPQPGGLGFWFENRPMTVARYSHTAGFVNGKLCVAGGISGGNPNHVLLSEAECYDLATDDWTPIASMNTPRFDAGSAVGGDGRWYVFGGTTVEDSQLVAATSTEVYDPITGIWTTLDFRFDINSPGRTWPRGGFVGSQLWITGGDEIPGNEVVPLVENTFFPPSFNNLSLPLTQSTYPGNSAGQTMGTSLQLNLNQPLYQLFQSFQDYFQVFYYDQLTTRSVTVKLSDIPVGGNYDLFVYDSNKFLLGGSINIGDIGESVVLPDLPPGRIFVFVVRAFPLSIPPTQAHRIAIEG